MAVTMADIAKLRKMSGAGMMDCKKALEEANNDFDKAMEIIRKKGQAVAAKRSDREASQGCVLSKTENGFAAIVALKCETDFVAKNEEFIKLTEAILDCAMASKPKTMDELTALPMGDGRSVAEHITDRIGVTGEKMEIGFYEFVEANGVSSYIHPGNMLATIVGFNEEVEYQVGRNVAMQVAAMNPVGITAEDVPAKIVDTEREIAREKAIESGKPENIIDKIVEGSLQKYFKENTLLSQDNIKDNKQTVEQYLKSQSATLTVTSFKRVTLNVE
ncbi:MAG: translation elongation factor Ts [Porphyromonas sp.]|nr:translation elongation factor Ts [Porphyromonas sp.]